MPDILVKLYALPRLPQPIAGVEVRAPLPHEKNAVAAWVAHHFEPGWAAEFEVSFRHSPASSFVAVREARLIGFACYEVTSRGFFGPTGVLETERGRGVGTELLLHSLWALRGLGYAYAIIGDAGPVAFYERTVGGLVIPNSEPGIYPPPLAGEA